MTTAILTDIGLNETQAKAYILLIKSGSLTPPELAEKLKIKRTNAYAVLDQLTEMGIAIKQDNRKKITYSVAHPIALERLAEKKRNEALEHEKLVQASLPTLLNFYHTFSDQPGVRFFQGTEGIKDIYNDTLRTKKDIYVIRSPYDINFLDEKFYTSYRKKRAQLGIETNILSSTTNFSEEEDMMLKVKRKFLGKKLYDAPVEIDIYGTKTALISFGNEAIGMIIESPQIANALKQLFMIIGKANDTSS